MWWHIARYFRVRGRKFIETLSGCEFAQSVPNALCNFFYSQHLPYLKLCMGYRRHIASRIYTTSCGLNLIFVQFRFWPLQFPLSWAGNQNYRLQAWANIQTAVHRENNKRAWHIQRSHLHPQLYWKYFSILWKLNKIDRETFSEKKKQCDAMKKNTHLAIADRNNKTVTPN
jgi:hypothetical protein